MLDELLIGGEVQETSKKNVLKAIAAQDLLQEVGQDPTCDHLLQSLLFLLLRRRHRKDFLMMQAWANIRFSTCTVGKLGDSVPTTSNQVPSSHDTVWWTGGPLLCLCREQLKHQVSMPQFFRY